MEKCKNQQRSRINKAFEKIPRFDGTNPSYCFDWLEQTEALVNKHQGRIYREELLLNCGTSVSKTIHALPQGATNQHIKDAVLRNHSNLRTVSQRSNAYHQLHQKCRQVMAMQLEECLCSCRGGAIFICEPYIFMLRK